MKEEVELCDDSKERNWKGREKKSEKLNKEKWNKIINKLIPWQEYNGQLFNRTSVVTYVRLHFKMTIIIIASEHTESCRW